MSVATRSPAGARPLAIVGAIAVAWALAVSAEISGRGAALHHDALIEGGCPTGWRSCSSSSHGRR